MKGRILTYGTSIHPGESWEEIEGNVARFVPRVKGALSPGDPFPIALRLSARAAAGIGPAESDRFLDWCGRHGCFVPLVNGFPYGHFHGAPVKERVYLPDWRSSERLDYTLMLADRLRDWMPEGGRGSISTVPVGYRDFLRPSDLHRCRENILAALERLEAIAAESGREIVLSLEPEPGCFLETTEEVVAFFAGLRLPPGPAAHLGVCFDCCHQALQFEDPVRSLELLSGAGIRIGHLQVSSALHLEGGDLGRLAGFDEPVYLHQAVALRDDGSLLRFPDLPRALAADPSGVVSWRVHFHLPVHLGGLPGGIGTTRPFLERILPRLDPGIPLEVETYTWEVLPPPLKGTDVLASVTRELEWVRDLLEGPPRAPARGVSSLPAAADLTRPAGGRINTSST